jgi:hypothetical protein
MTLYISYVVTSYYNQNLHCHKTVGKCGFLFHGRGVGVEYLKKLMKKPLVKNSCKTERDVGG